MKVGLEEVGLESEPVREGWGGEHLLLLELRGGQEVSQLEGEGVQVRWRARGVEEARRGQRE